MKRNQIAQYLQIKNQIAINDFEEMIHDIHLIYSLNQLNNLRYISDENIIEALQKSILICTLIGENSKRHFKQIYVFDDSQRVMHIDWIISKKGVHLMMLQMKTIDKSRANWLWKMADVQIHKTI
jgi:hypothetical protein